MKKSYLFALIFLSLFSLNSSATEYFVSKKGKDTNSGSSKSPFLTISAAAKVAKPGDVITVHAGIYRETVDPLRGGDSEQSRIVYKAAPGEKVSIRGSEQIKKWVKDGTIWKVELPNSSFGDYNPYDRKIGWASENWLDGGRWTHCGDVYLNGEAFYEKRTKEAVAKDANSWYCEVDNAANVTRIWANFGSANPNKEVAEINYRECIISPSNQDVNFITISGFSIMQAATAWGPPTSYQSGAIATNGGHHWIVENCEIINSKTNGFSMGIPRSRSFGTAGVAGQPAAGQQRPAAGQQRSGFAQDYNAVGHHIIRNNIFRRCGQSAIVGNGYNSGTLIVGNYIGETSYRYEFWGSEPSAIKFHNGCDLVIVDNYVDKTNRVMGLWIDSGNQNIRVSRNIFEVKIFGEMNHGPILIDNNIITGDYSNRASEATTIANNLLILKSFKHTHDPYRRSGWTKPHTRERLGNELCFLRDERWYNNIYVSMGMDSLTVIQPGNDDIGRTPTNGPRPQSIQLNVDPLVSNYGCNADYNLYLKGAQKHPRYDSHSIVSDFDPQVSLKEENGDLIVTIVMNDEASKIDCPLITTDFLGVYEPTKLMMENNDGSPIYVNSDILNKPRNSQNPGVGPFADLKPGVNRFVVFSMKGKGPQVSE